MALTLRSTENYYDRKHGCVVIGVVDPNKILVRLVPPMPKSAYQRIVGGPMRSDIDRLVLAPRHVGDTLAPTMSALPFYVNMCVPKPEGTWMSGPWSILDIGLLEVADDDRAVV